MAELLPPSFIPFPWGLLRRSLRRADFSERIRRRRPTFRSFTRRGRRRDGRRDERTAISESVHYCYCFARRAAVAVPSLLRMRGWGVKRRRRPFARSEEESSPMTKWKVRSDRTNESGDDRKQVERDWRLERERTVGWLDGPLVRSRGQRPEGPLHCHTHFIQSGRSVAREDRDFASASVYLLSRPQSTTE